MADSATINECSADANNKSGRNESSSNTRFLVLIIATFALAAVFANVLSLNFVIVCMTEEKFRFENFSLDLGFDIFERVELEPRRTTTDLAVPDEATRKSGAQGFSTVPDIRVPGIHFPTPGFNWQSLRLARHNPDLFLKLLKKFAWETAKLGANRLGQAMDPRNVDFARFSRGLNFSDVSWDSALRLRDHVLQRLELARHFAQQTFDEQGRNVSFWRNIRHDDIELGNITWNGVINGRIKIVERPADYYFQRGEKVGLLMAFALGALPALFAVEFGFRKLGCRKTFALAGLASALSTALCPLMASFGFFTLFLARLIQGFGFAACFPTIGAILLEWTAADENEFFIGILSCFLPAAVVMSFPLSGILCATLGWPSSFYAHALISAMAIVFWWILFRDRPVQHPRVSATELRQIQCVRSTSTNDQQKPNASESTLGVVFKERFVLASWLAALGSLLATMFVLLFAPTMFREKLSYCQPRLSFVLALAFLAQLCVRACTAMVLCRRRTGRLLALDKTLRRRSFNCVAFIGAGLSFATVAFFALYANCFHGALWALIPAFALLGFEGGGFYETATNVRRDLVLLTAKTIQVVACLATILVALLFWATNPDEIFKWFLGCSLVLVTSNLVYWHLTPTAGPNSGRAEQQEQTTALVEAALPQNRNEDQEANVEKQ